MLNIRKRDPSFINWDPVTAADAVDKYQRLQNLGVPAARIPEALISCSRKLRGEELDMFTEWIINPSDVRGCDYRDVFYKTQANETKKLLQEHQLKDEVHDEKQDDAAHVETPPVEMEPLTTKCAAQSKST